jgi:hypothetical protein
LEVDEGNDSIDGDGVSNPDPEPRGEDVEEEEFEEQEDNNDEEEEVPALDGNTGDAD